MSDGGKGSGRRPGQGYQDNWDKIFGKKICPPCHGNCNQGRTCPARGSASTASGVLPVAGAEQEHREQSVPHHPKGGGTLPVREAASAST